MHCRRLPSLRPRRRSPRYRQKPVSFVSPAVTMSDFRPTILSAVLAALEPVTRQQNARLPAFQLPNELLAEVFAYLNERDRANITLVCREWKDILFSFPNIWRYIEVEMKKPGMVAKLISFSQTATISLDIVIDSENWRELAECLPAAISRCASLTVTLNSGFPMSDVEAVSAICKAMCHPTPALKRFRLFDHRGAWGHDVEGLVLFAGQAPRLESVKLHSDSTAFSSSVDSLKTATKVLFSPSDDLARPQIVALCKIFASARELSIEVDGVSSLMTDSDLKTKEEAIELPAGLQELSIIANRRLSGAVALLEVFADLVRIPRVCISLNESAVTSDIYDAFRLITSGIGPFRSLRLESSSSKGDFNIYVHPEETVLDEITGSANRGAPLQQRCMLDTQRQLDLSTLGVFEHVTTMYFGELVFTLGEEPLPAVPNLLHLTVFTVKHAYQQRDGHNSVFILPARGSETYGFQFERRLRCPKLRTLCLSTRNGETWSGGHVNTATRLAPEAVCEFLETFLHFEAPRLEVLRLRGPELLQNDVAGVERLLALVDVLEIEPRKLDWTYEFNRLLTWH
ncbi:hypothetical protein BKA62DRAFT_699239 [Auriculariales sp. MPI-PUGE-AT-0066]|nr:hypothetical protein BKA62DRAFT_699239 [Auriculariales sp. MPI-PUGE-AT-0066]